MDVPLFYRYRTATPFHFHLADHLPEEKKAYLLSRLKDEKGHLAYNGKETKNAYVWMSDQLPQPVQALIVWLTEDE